MSCTRRIDERTEMHGKTNEIRTCTPDLLRLLLNKEDVGVVVSRDKHSTTYM